ncbi:hypothetical protein K437DRAFT_276303 [Tilletiaria anomala UBC 951]|uniref:Uncharacterized protein n=1 Tax=Tilletiaria anomala (strain ATCC 24038 / CBS 436.72 / UBC 951) TaxID=1037660 RepID=A0A066VIK6_TILAU|nr:uncharacterized protein K437DRAFT_276303 [Tilletiaria anomala UBC 951]KDN38390.1 hypothetical protein K437DRAFT_276303 [Tilletiaria anomala UBC 951]
MNSANASESSSARGQAAQAQAGTLTFAMDAQEGTDLIGAEEVAQLREHVAFLDARLQRVEDEAAARTEQLLQRLTTLEQDWSLIRILMASLSNGNGPSGTQSLSHIQGVQTGNGLLSPSVSAIAAVAAAAVNATNSGSSGRPLRKRSRASMPTPPAGNQSHQQSSSQNGPSTTTTPQSSMRDSPSSTRASGTNKKRTAFTAGFESPFSGVNAHIAKAAHLSQLATRRSMNAIKTGQNPGDVLDAANFRSTSNLQPLPGPSWSITRQTASLQGSTAASGSYTAVAAGQGSSSEVGRPAAEAGLVLPGTASFGGEQVTAAFAASPTNVASERSRRRPERISNGSTDGQAGGSAQGGERSNATPPPPPAANTSTDAFRATVLSETASHQEQDTDENEESDRALQVAAAAAAAAIGQEAGRASEDASTSYAGAADTPIQASQGDHSIVLDEFEELPIPRVNTVPEVIAQWENGDARVGMKPLKIWTPRMINHPRYLSTYADRKRIVDAYQRAGGTLQAFYKRYGHDKPLKEYKILIQAMGKQEGIVKARQRSRKSASSSTDKAAGSPSQNAPSEPQRQVRQRASGRASSREGAPSAQTGESSGDANDRSTSTSGVDDANAELADANTFSIVDAMVDPNAQ